MITGYLKYSSPDFKIGTVLETAQFPFAVKKGDCVYKTTAGLSLTPPTSLSQVDINSKLYVPQYNATANTDVKSYSMPLRAEQPSGDTVSINTYYGLTGSSEDAISPTLTMGLNSGSYSESTTSAIAFDDYGAPVFESYFVDVPIGNADVSVEFYLLDPVTTNTYTYDITVRNSTNDTDGDVLDSFTGTLVEEDEHLTTGSLNFSFDCQPDGDGVYNLYYDISITNN